MPVRNNVSRKLTVLTADKTDPLLLGQQQFKEEKMHLYKKQGHFVSWHKAAEKGRMLVKEKNKEEKRQFKTTVSLSRARFSSWRLPLHQSWVK